LPLHPTAVTRLNAVTRTRIHMMNSGVWVGIFYNSPQKG
jgi:hypothetical protein